MMRMKLLRKIIMVIIITITILIIWLHSFIIHLRFSMIQDEETKFRNETQLESIQSVMDTTFNILSLKGVVSLEYFISQNKTKHKYGSNFRFESHF